MTIIKSDRVRMQPQSVLVNHDPEQQRATVVIKRRDELISEIEVTCSCGRKMILDCVYNPDSRIDEELNFSE